MAQPEKRENSVLFSLRELRSIEETRIKEEEDAAKTAEEARIRARMEEERRQREAEEAKVRAAEDAARREQDAHNQRVREDALRVQEAEARARAEHQANLEAHRLQQEMEIRRQEVQKKWPVWLVVAVGIFAVITIGAVIFMVQSSNKADQEKRDRQAAEVKRQEAERIAKQKEQETAELKAQVDGLIAALADLDNQMKESERQLTAATSQAERDKVAARQAEIRRQQRAAQERLDKVKAGVKLKCPPDQPLC
jgi:colicin import membrane protein